MRFLSKEIFECVVKNTPLISIDLIVFNENKEVLLGRRVNPPAKGLLFVPGGRIFKDETVAEAFKRISLSELGKVISKDSAKFLGVYEHFYNNSIFGDHVTTHYIVLAFSIFVRKNNLILPKVQHSEYLWLEPKKLLLREDVHTYTKNYFRRL